MGCVHNTKDKRKDHRNFSTMKTIDVDSFDNGSIVVMIVDFSGYLIVMCFVVLL